MGAKVGASIDATKIGRVDNAEQHADQHDKLAVAHHHLVSLQHAMATPTIFSNLQRRLELRLNARADQVALPLKGEHRIDAAPLGAVHA